MSIPTKVEFYKKDGEAVFFKAMRTQVKKICCRWSPTLGDLEGTAEQTWGTSPYNPETDRDLPCVFFGLYGLPDFYTLWRHRGKRWILWAGTDILHFEAGYWLEDGGEVRIDRRPLARWIARNCESWCENVVEQKKLAEMGIPAKVCPSFLGDVKQFTARYSQGACACVYASVSGDNFTQYGWDVIERVARKVPKVCFFLYGNRKKWKTKNRNVIVMGRCEKSEMNAQIKDMNAGLRPLRFDGASEILMKSVLMGQYPISRIPYPHIASYRNDKELIRELRKLAKHNKPNYRARNYYLRKLNRFPWNTKI